MPVFVSSFRGAVGLKDRELILESDRKGEAQVSHRSFLGRLKALVKRGQAANANHEVKKQFLLSLTRDYGEQIAQAALKSSGINIDSNTSLRSRQVKVVIANADELKYQKLEQAQKVEIAAKSSAQDGALFRRLVNLAGISAESLSSSQRQYINEGVKNLAFLGELDTDYLKLESTKEGVVMARNLSHLKDLAAAQGSVYSDDLKIIDLIRHADKLGSVGTQSALEFFSAVKNTAADLSFALRIGDNDGYVKAMNELSQNMQKAMHKDLLVTGLADSVTELISYSLQQGINSGDHMPTGREYVLTSSFRKGLEQLKTVKDDNAGLSLMRLLNDKVETAVTSSGKTQANDADVEDITMRLKLILSLGDAEKISRMVDEFNVSRLQKELDDSAVAAARDEKLSPLVSALFSSNDSENIRASLRIKSGFAAAAKMDSRIKDMVKKHQSFKEQNTYAYLGSKHSDSQDLLQKVEALVDEIKSSDSAYRELHEGLDNLAIHTSSSAAEMQRGNDHLSSLYTLYEVENLKVLPKDHDFTVHEGRIEPRFNMEALSNDFKEEFNKYFGEDIFRDKYSPYVFRIGDKDYSISRQFLVDVPRSKLMRIKNGDEVKTLKDSVASVKSEEDIAKDLVAACKGDAALVSRISAVTNQTLGNFAIAGIASLAVSKSMVDSDTVSLSDLASSTSSAYDIEIDDKGVPLINASFRVSLHPLGVEPLPIDAVTNTIDIKYSFIAPVDGEVKIVSPIAVADSDG